METSSIASWTLMNEIPVPDDVREGPAHRLGSAEVTRLSSH
jgi:hypothetical protein